MYEGLHEDARDVVTTLNRKQLEIQAKDGLWYSMRMVPYRTVENVIDGVVITFSDITEIRKAKNADAARRFTDNIIATVREPFLVINKQLRVISSNRSFYETFKVSAKQTEGKLIYELGNGQWDIPDLRQLLEEILPDNTTIEDYEVNHEFETIGTKTMLLNARRIVEEEEEEEELILLAIEDITGRKRAE